LSFHYFHLSYPRSPTLSQKAPRTITHHVSRLNALDQALSKVTQFIRDTLEDGGMPCLVCLDDIGRLDAVGGGGLTFGGLKQRLPTLAM
jgi:hypothetical protein